MYILYNDSLLSPHPSTLHASNSSSFSNHHKTFSVLSEDPPYFTVFFIVLQVFSFAYLYALPRAVSTGDKLPTADLEGQPVILARPLTTQKWEHYLKTMLVCEFYLIID